VCRAVRGWGGFRQYGFGHCPSRRHQDHSIPTPPYTTLQSTKMTRQGPSTVLSGLVLLLATARAFSPNPLQQQPSPPSSHRPASSSSSPTAMEGVGRAGAVLGQLGGALAALAVLGLPIAPAGTWIKACSASSSPPPSLPHPPSLSHSIPSLHSRRHASTRIHAQH